MLMLSRPADADGRRPPGHGDAAHVVDVPMPISFRIDRAHGVVLSRAWGEVLLADAHEHHRRLAADPDFDPSFVQLVDVRDVTRVDGSAGAVRSIAQRPVFAPGTRRAFVVSTTEQYGIARMYASLCAFEGEVVEVFRKWETATWWLGLPDDIGLHDDERHARHDRRSSEGVGDEEGHPQERPGPGS